MWLLSLMSIQCHLSQYHSWFPVESDILQYCDDISASVQCWWSTFSLSVFWCSELSWCCGGCASVTSLILHFDWYFCVIVFRDDDLPVIHVSVCVFCGWWPVPSILIQLLCGIVMTDGYIPICPVICSLSNPTVSHLSCLGLNAILWPGWSGSSCRQCNAISIYLSAKSGPSVMAARPWHEMASSSCQLVAQKCLCCANGNLIDTSSSRGCLW
jgi:hypothetical protein